MPLLCSYLSLLRTVTRTKALKGVVWGDQINLQNLHIISRLSFSIFRELQELQLLRGFQDGLLLTLQWLSLLLKSTKFLECKTCIFGCILFSVWNSMWHNKWSCLKGSGTLELKQVGHESHKCCLKTFQKTLPGFPHPLLQHRTWQMWLRSSIMSLVCSLSFEKID